MLEKKEETGSLAHTRWNCEYHIVCAPKYCKLQTDYKGANELVVDAELLGGFFKQSSLF